MTRDWVNDAVNVPPYNGRPIFEIEHGSTAPQQKQINQETATLTAQITADISHCSDDL